jgi:hypothetical protein
MSPELAEKLKRRTDRRSFLRGSALIVAAGAIAPLDGWAQNAQNPAPPADGTPAPGDTQSSGQQGNQPEKKSGDAEPSQTAKEGEGEKTYVGADGRPYRVCPQCGANMYKQDRTWTCENCGYSYVE